tara:strand:+ start:2455 stop:2670 length:216 start_codon:yes stop_codon:yes gene_type:complete
MSDIKVGDLVRVNESLPEWKHLGEKKEDHCLRGHGIIVEVREVKYVVRFGSWTAYLKESDLIKLTKEEADE